MAGPRAFQIGRVPWLRCHGARMRRRTLLLVGTSVVLLLAVLVQPARAASCPAGHVRLTFDDGPTPAATADVLDTLTAGGAPATFFVTGSMAAANPALVRRARAGGLRSGNHS